MTTTPIEGGCQCRSVRYRISGEPVMTVLCHCTTCRRANAAPAVAWVMYPQDQVVFTQQQPTVYESSPGARRGFCPRCGTQISFTGDLIPGLIDLTIGSLDRPEEMPPALHCWDSKRLPWVQFADTLPRYPEFPLAE